MMLGCNKNVPYETPHLGHIRWCIHEFMMYSVFFYGKVGSGD